MKRGIAILVSLSALLTVAYFTWSKWAIRHETLTFYDASRDNRPVAVDIAVRWDKEMQASAVAVRTRGGEDLGAMPVDALLARLQSEMPPGP